MGKLVHVDLLGQLSPDRALDVFGVGQPPAGQRPPVDVRFLGALPEHHLQPVVADLKDPGEHFVTNIALVRAT